MLVLHVAWSSQIGLFGWAEDSLVAVTSGSEAVRQARPHPFAATTAQLSEASDGGELIQAVVQLPSLRRAPLDSPELVRSVPRSAGQGQPSLLPWTVPGVAIDPFQILPADTDLEVRAGASLHFVQRLSDFVGDLVARGRVLPTIVLPTLPRSGADEAPPAHARWRALLTGADAVHVHALLSAMPPAFRAAAPDVAPSSLGLIVLNELVDAQVRHRLPASFLPPRRGRKPAVTPAAEAWLQALTSTESAIAADADAIAELHARLAEWDEFGQRDPGPATLVLRLVEPADDTVTIVLSEEVTSGLNEALDAARYAPEAFAAARPDPDPGTTRSEPTVDAEPDPDPLWSLQFLLRSRDDPSLLVDASAVWSGDGGLERWLRSPREVLLTELARAQRSYPELERGLRGARPDGLTLGTAEAHHFLAEAATVLDEAGFEVQLPGWWSRKRRVGLRLSATPSDGDELDSDFGKEALADFHWDIAVGEHVLTDEEFAALAAAKAPLVRLRGEWVAVDQDRLSRGLAFVREYGSGQMSARRVVEVGLSHPDDLDLPLDVLEADAGGWIGDLLNGTAAVADVEPAAGFLAQLRPYQQRGLGWLDFLGRLGLGGVLADDMGLGKTVQLLAWEATARARGSGAPTLLLCPMSLIGNWQAEAQRFAPELRVWVHYGPGRATGDELRTRMSDADLVITTYATALRDIDELAGIRFERVVLDEAQAVKNRLSKAAKAVRRLDARQRIALTGTPVENRLSELWSIMDFVNPGMLGAHERFRERFSRPIERDADPEAAALLRRVTRPYILRRLKTDPAIIDDLPEKIEITQHYRLTLEQATLYQSVVDDMMDRIERSEGIERRGNVLAAMTKLKQVCNHPAQLLHDHSALGRRSGKLIRFEEILEEILAEGDRVICFTQFTEFAEMLVPHLAARFDTDVAYLSGSTSRTRRTELVERFQSGEGAPVFLLSLKAGGTGLNLTAANQVVHLDRWWNPAVENQATDRAFRIGQKRRVQVRKFVGVGTLEERIDQLIEQKKALADLVVGDGESWLSELSTGELRALFTLSKDAVGE